MSAPRVHKPSPTAIWEKEHRWGHELGDVRCYAVAASSGRLAITVGRTTLDIPVDLVEWFADAVAQAAAWTPEETP